jgi:hypothetical protein
MADNSADIAKRVSLGAVAEGMRHIQMHQYWMQINQTLPGQPQKSQQDQQSGQPVNVKSSPEIEGGFEYNQELKEQL